MTKTNLDGLLSKADSFEKLAILGKKNYNLKSIAQENIVTSELANAITNLVNRVRSLAQSWKSVQSSLVVDKLEQANSILDNNISVDYNHLENIIKKESLYKSALNVISQSISMAPSEFSNQVGVIINNIKNVQNEFAKNTNTSVEKPRKGTEFAKLIKYYSLLKKGRNLVNKLKNATMFDKEILSPELDSIVRQMNYFFSEFPEEYNTIGEVRTMSNNMKSILSDIKSWKKILAF